MHLADRPEAAADAEQQKARSVSGTGSFRSAIMGPLVAGTRANLYRTRVAYPLPASPQ